MEAHNPLAENRLRRAPRLLRLGFCYYELDAGRHSCCEAGLWYVYVAMEQIGLYQFVKSLEVVTGIILLLDIASRWRSFWNSRLQSSSAAFALSLARSIASLVGQPVTQRGSRRFRRFESRKVRAPVNDHKPGVRDLRSELFIRAW